MFDRTVERRVERTDLTRDGFRCDGRLHRTAIRVTEDENRFDAEDCDRVFKAGDNFRRDQIASYARDEEAADRLIEDQLDRHTRIGTRKNRRERFLLVGGVTSEDFEILLNRRQLISHAPLIAGEQFLHCFSGRKIRLSINYTR
jgi:hypothetical protein